MSTHNVGIAGQSLSSYNVSSVGPMLCGVLQGHSVCEMWGFYPRTLWFYTRKTAPSGDSLAILGCKANSLAKLKHSWEGWGISDGWGQCGQERI